MRVLWNTEIYKRYKDIFHITLYEQIIMDDIFNSNYLTIQSIDDTKGIEVLEDADQIKSIATGEYFLMSEIVMAVPDELLDIYELIPFVECRYSISYTTTPS